MSSGISSTKEQAGHGFPFISFSTVFNNYFLPDAITDLMDTSEKERATYSILEDDILITRTSETIDELAMSSVALREYKNVTYSGFTKRLRPKDGTKDIVYSKYIAFYLRSKLFRKVITNNAFMTLRASFNEDIFSFLKLYLPEIRQQEKIGNFLYFIYQKIQTNKKIIAELESMAKTLYDYWFVQFDFPDENGKPYKSSGGKMVYNNELKREIPIGWGVENLLSIESNIVTGKTPTTSNLNFYNGDIPFITIKDIRNNLFIANTEQTLSKSGAESQKKQYIEANSLCISCIATVGLVGITTAKSQTNQQINSVSCKNQENVPYLYFALKDYFKNLSTIKSGATFKNMNKTEFSSILILLPTSKIKRNFYEIINPTFRKIKNLNLENTQLTTLRDWLLPMLMNGQVSVE